MTKSDALKGPSPQFSRRDFNAETGKLSINALGRGPGSTEADAAMANAMMTINFRLNFMVLI